MRADLIETQKGRCAICSRTEDLVLDHCHETRRVRGVLCSECNRGLGFFRDDPRRLVRAIRYLQRGTMNVVYPCWRKAERLRAKQISGTKREKARATG